MKPIRSQIVPVALQLLGELGHDPTRVIDALGLPRTTLHDAEVRLSLRKIRATLSALERAAGDPLVGVRLAERTPVGRHGLVDYIVRHVATLEDAFAALVRFTPLFSDVLVYATRERRSTVTLEVEILGEPLLLGPVGNECLLGLLLQRFRRLTGRDFVPLRSWLAHPTSGRDARGIAAALSLRHLEFGVGRVGFELPREAARWPLMTADATLAGFLVAHAEHLLNAHPTPSRFLGLVKQALRREVERGLPKLERTARSLRMTPRTLQRRIAGEGETYRALVESTQHEHASALLASTERPVTEIALSLGYRDPSSFTRSFSKWQGTSPRDYRARHRGRRSRG